ncbi:MAG: potassium-transporting ATPase subunit KdpA [Proteobacteria bacterium]|nr:MAG: potassium-transporting ATPase subunit KdpA [Pseudomonadota bacterium]
MTAVGWLQILAFAAVIFAVTKPLGSYLFRVLEGERRPLERLFGPLERALYAVGGVDPRREQTWLQYAGALLAFSCFGLLVTYAVLRLQAALPLNQQRFGGLSPHLAWNTAVSFSTNTNWQSYGGESTLSYFSQMAALAWHNFTSAAAGIAVAIAMARGFTRSVPEGGARTIGCFWADTIRAIVYLLLPLSGIVALGMLATGVIQNFSPYLEVTTLEGAKQVLGMGPVASQEAIKQLGTNGGGFFNANAAHPFENPTPLSNFASLVLIFAIPAALTHTYGRMARDARQGWALFAAMALLFFAGVSVAYWAEARGNPAFAGLAVEPGAGNWEGKESRFGIAASALYATVTTGASCGAVNSMHDSFTALGGLVPLFDIQLGEVVFGGVGAGLYGMLVYVVIAVFLAGLMVGRTPEYLGKKIEAREMKLASLYILLFPLLILGFAAWSAAAPYGVSSLANAGPHGLAEILYAYSSAAGNNGSAFAGLAADTPWWNTTLGIAMLAGRFLMIVPALAIAGAMVGKKVVPESLGTFPTHGALFGALLTGVVVVVGALTFFPALALGPIVEHFLAEAGKLY